MGFLKRVLVGEWETVETRKVSYVVTNNVTKEKKDVEATLIIEQNTKTEEFRCYTKDAKGDKTEWDFDYVRTHILEDNSKETETDD